MTKTVYISIGNSDNKLTQADWSSYALDVDRAFDAAVRYEGAVVHGRWYSLPHEPWQNACWCAEWHDDLDHVLQALKRKLATIARAHRQDSIAWAEATTTFIGPPARCGATYRPNEHMRGFYACSLEPGHDSLHTSETTGVSWSTATTPSEEP